MSRRTRLLPLALSVAALLATGPGLLGPHGPAGAPAGAAEQVLPERLILNPTAAPETSQAVTWRTAEDVTNPRVELRGPSGTTTVPVDETTKAWEIGQYAPHHSVVLDDLAPATDYEYRVGSDAGWSGWHTFTTATPADADGTPADPWTFLYFGDAQNGLDGAWRPVMKQAFEKFPDARVSLHAGDQINEAHNDSEWASWFEGFAPWVAEHTVATASGNHEMTVDPTRAAYRAHYTYPSNGAPLRDQFTYHFDQGGVRFIVLDGNDPLGSPTQRDWLEETLRTNPNKWAVAVFHHPMFSATEGRDNLATRNAWLPLFEEYGIDLVLQGHDHAYARGHLAENHVDEHTQDGPVYTVAVGGTKYYTLDPEGDNNWTRNGAVRVRAAGQTSTYQAVRVEDDQLVYESYAASFGSDPTPKDRKVGDLLDALTVTKTSAGDKRVTEGVAPTVQARFGPTRNFGKSVVMATDVTIGERPVTEGTVEVRKGSKVIARGVPGGTVRLPADLAVGTHRLSVAYSGTEYGVRAATHEQSLRISPAKASITVSSKPLRKGRAHAVRVRATYGTPTGRVTLRAGGRTLGTAWLRSGLANVPVKVAPRSGGTLWVQYAGDARTRKTSKSVRFSVAR